MQNILFVAGLVLAVLVFFVVLWMSIALLLSRVGGWSKLAQRYRAQQAAPARCEALPVAFVESARYRGGALAAAICPEGLYLAVSPLFSPGHPPLLLPWSAILDVSAARAFRGVRLYQLATDSGISIMLPAAVVEKARPYLGHLARPTA